LANFPEFAFGFTGGSLDTEMLLALAIVPQKQKAPANADHQPIHRRGRAIPIINLE
jgi:hypothetical protein